MPLQAHVHLTPTQGGSSLRDLAHRHEGQLDQILQDSLFLEERRSSEYIKVMTHIQAAMDVIPAEKITIDLRDITSRRGSLIYLVIEGVPKEIPFDILYAPRLKYSIRENLVQEMDIQKSRLSLSHRRLLSRLKRIHKLAALVDTKTYDVRHKTEATRAEISRILEISKQAYGVRKMDILMEALLIPARSYFDLLQTLECIENDQHPQHAEALAWLTRSKYFGKVPAFKAALKDAFRRLSESVDVVYDEVEALTGLKFSRGLEHIETQSCWFDLGPVAQEEEPVQDPTRVAMRDRLRHSRFQELKREWSQAWFEDREHKILAWAGDDPQRQAAGLSRLLMVLQQKVEDSPNPQGTIHMSLENDLNLHLISTFEYDDAKTWIIENWKGLVRFADQLTQRLETLRQHQPHVVLPQTLYEDLERIKEISTTNTQELQRELGLRFKVIDVAGMEEATDAVVLGPSTDVHTLRHLFSIYTRVQDTLGDLKPGDVPFLRQLRLAFENIHAFEAHLEKLYYKQDHLEQLKLKLESKIFRAYRDLDHFSQLELAELERCQDVAVHHMYTCLANHAYHSIDMSNVAHLIHKALECGDKGERYLRFYYLLQEVEAIPELQLLKEAVSSCPGITTKEKASRLQFLEENQRKRLQIEAQLRTYLRDHLGYSDKETRRARFEVFGFNACLASSLERSLNILVDEIPRLANLEDGTSIAEEVSALEARLIEAQALSRCPSEFSKRITSMYENGEIEQTMETQLLQDMEDNYCDLENLMAHAGKTLKRAREQQIRFGLQRDTRYLNLTLNLPDLEELKSSYGFLESLSLEDLKRYCLSYRMSRDMTADLLRKLETGDGDIDPEIRKQYVGRARKAMLETFSPSAKSTKRSDIPAMLKLAMLRHDAPIFESEAQRLMYFLNYADPEQIREKNMYRNYVKLLRLSEDGDVKTNRSLKHVTERLRKLLAEYKPEGYRANYEHNRNIFLRDLDNVYGVLKWY